MSLEIVLVPLAFAAVGAWKARRPESDNAPTIQVASRMRHGGLLVNSLNDLGLAVTHEGEGHISAAQQEGEVAFRRNEEDLWVATFAESWTEIEAMELLTKLDVAYGRQVQKDVIAKIHERAPAAGMHITSEAVDNEETVTLMLSVGRVQ